VRIIRKSCLALGYWQSMFALLAVIPTLLLQGHPTAAQTFEVTPSKISAGEQATLSWDVGDAHAYVVGYGDVSGKGSATVSPEGTTDYILSAEYPGKKPRYETRKQTLVVTGIRGDDDDTPSLTRFGDPIHGTCKGVSYVDFQRKLWNLLQSFGYKVRGDYQVERPYLRIYTNFVPRGDLIAEGEKLRGRRLAWALDLYQPSVDAPLAFDLHTQYQLEHLGETKWLADNYDPGASAKVTKVKSDEETKMMKALEGMQ
jgi:hypothetical protein